MQHDKASLLHRLTPTAKSSGLFSTHSRIIIFIITIRHSAAFSVLGCGDALSLVEQFEYLDYGNSKREEAYLSLERTIPSYTQGY